MKKKRLFLDFESYFSRAEGMDLRTLPIMAYVRDPRFKVHGFGWCEEEGTPVWITGSLAQSWFDSITPEERADIALVGQNVKFDAFIAAHAYGFIAGQYIDTKAMSKAVLGKSIIGHSLADLANHFGLPAKGHMTCEGVVNLSPEQEAELADYCNHDVWLTREVFNRLNPDFPEGQYGLMDWTVRTFVDPKLNLNVPLLRDTAENERKVKKLQFEMLGIEKSVFSSNDKFAALLTERGFEVPMKPSPRKKDEAGKPLMIPALAMGDVDFRELLESNNEEIRTLCQARKAAKSNIIETRADQLVQIGDSGKWAFDVEFSGADQTHRFSGGKGAGGNPQNFPRGSALRKAVEAPDGYSLVVGDLANIELRIVAYLANDVSLISGIENGIDLYCDFASVFYGRTITKEDKLERFFGKTAILGLGYGMGWRKFQHTVRLATGMAISDEDAKRAVDLYRKRYTGVTALWAYLEKAIASINNPTTSQLGFLPVWIGQGGLTLPSGLRLKYPLLRRVEGKRPGLMEWGYTIYDKRRQTEKKLYGGKLLENISQALAGEVCKETLEKFMDVATGQVHDEIHLLVPDTRAKEYATRLTEEMSRAPGWMEGMKLASEVGFGKNWLEAK